MSAPEAGSGLALPIPIPRVAVERSDSATTPRRTPQTPRGGLPPASPSLGTPRGARRSMDGRRSRHTVEVPEGAESLEGLVVSRQEKFGFIKCITHDGRYFFHVNDSDGAAAYGSTVSFVVAKDLTTGKDVAYNVKTTAGPPAPGSASPRMAAARGSAAAPRASTPDPAASLAAGLTPAEGTAFFRSGSGGGDATPTATSALGAAPDGGEPAAQPPPPLPSHPQPPQLQRSGGAGPSPAPPNPQQPRRQQQQPPPQLLHPQQGDLQGRTGFEHFGQHRQPSPATQRDWRLPRETPPPQEQPRRGGTPGPGPEVGPSPNQAPGCEAPTPVRYRATVAQVARAGRHHQADDGLLLYQDEQGQQQQARYGNHRLAEGTIRLEAGDVVDFAAEGHPGAGGGLRRAATEVRFLSRPLAPAPFLEGGLAPGAAPDSADSMRGRQLGRIQLLKKEFGFIRQVDRPGDMFFHFSQLDGWAPEDIKVDVDVEYTIRRDREGKLSAVQIRRAPPGSVVFEVVGEETLRGVVLERPNAGKQYLPTSGVLEFAIQGQAGGEGEAAAAAAASALLPPGLAPDRARLPFEAKHVQQGSGSLRPGDHVTFRVATNLQAARAAAAASVPGAAYLAGKHATGVALLRYAGLVAQVNRERQFGFILYSEEQVLEGPAGGAAPPPSPAPAAGEAAGEAGGEATPATAFGQEAAAAPAEGNTTPSQPPAEAAAPAAEVAALPAAPAPATEPAAAAESSAEPAATAAAPAAPEAPKRKLFFHFKEVSGQHILKPGDEVAFVLHTNLKNGELNAQRVRRTKEGPELPLEPEPAPRPAPVPAVNPYKNKYSGNLAVGGHRQPKIAKGPDGTRGFEFERPNAVMPPLPGLEPKPEPESEPEPEAEAAEEETAGNGSEGGPPSQGGGAEGGLSLAEAALSKLKLANLSVQAPVFVPRVQSSCSLDHQVGAVDGVEGSSPPGQP